MLFSIFSMFSVFFFYTQRGFVSYLLVDICIIHNHIVAFFSFSSLEMLWYYLSQAFFQSFFIILIIFSWWIFRHFCKCKKIYTNKLFGEIKLLHVNFIMIYIIHKISVLLKITRILKYFLRSKIDFYFLKKKINFFTRYNDEKVKAWRR